MTSGMKTITYPVKDLAAAKRLYGRLFGAELYIDEPYYAAFNAGGQDVGLDPNGHGLEALLDAGAEPGQPIQDVGGGALIATVRDADGNVTGLFQAPAGG
jgi:catechol 2,3-dioxygenase-like lactoylglutathione lyase family enzyme